MADLADKMSINYTRKECATEAANEASAIALYVKDGGRMCEWHSVDANVRHFYRLAAIKNPPGHDGAGG